MRSPTVLSLVLLSLPLAAQDGLSSADSLFEEPAVVLNTDSIEATFQYQFGALQVAEGAVSLNLSDSFKFLGGDQARQLVVDLWENPPSIADKLLGVISYADAGAFDPRSSFIVYFDPIGYVSDADADGIDYNSMLKDMLKEDSLENAQRTDEGYSALWLVGWASPPFYDKKAKVLHWAKEMRQDSVEDNVLNYNIRVLGRRGVIIINGVTGMSRLDEMKAEVPRMIDLIAFNDGHRYDQFNADTDEVADWGIGGLVDGKVKEKVVGTLKLLLKVAAIALVSLIAIVALVVILVRRKRKAPMS